MEITLSELEKERDLADRQAKRAELCLDSALKRRNKAIKMIEEFKKVDYSKFIGFDGSYFAILGETALYFNNHTEGLYHSNYHRAIFNKPYSYIDVPCSELQKGDIVCFYPELKINKLCKDDFGIVIGELNNDDVTFQILNDVGVEVISYIAFDENHIVRKFIKEK